MNLEKAKQSNSFRCDRTLKNYFYHSFFNLYSAVLGIMAKKKDIIKVKGTVGDITFYKMKDDHLAREKGGIEVSRISSDQAFQRTRENRAEFVRAGKAGKTLRTALRILLINSADSRMVSRLTYSMVKVIQEYMINGRGLRNMIDSEAELLAGLLYFKYFLKYVSNLSKGIKSTLSYKSTWPAFGI